METISLLVVALLLFICSKPMLQGASRISELLIYLFGSGHDARRRNLMISSEMSPEYQDIIVDTVIRDPVVPGSLIFAFAYFNSTQKLFVETQITPAVLTTTLSFVFVFTLFRIMAGLRRSATPSVLPASHAISLSCFIFASILALFYGLSTEAITAAFVVTTFASQLGTTISRGVRNYGVFCIFWVPVAYFSWLTRVFSMAIAAPIIVPLALIESYLEKPGPLSKNPG